MEQNCQDGEKVETPPRMLPPGYPWDCRSIAAKSIWRHTAYSQSYTGRRSCHQRAPSTGEGHRLLVGYPLRLGHVRVRTSLL